MNIQTIDSRLSPVVPGSLKNQNTAGKATGFQLSVRLLNGRGCFLSILNGFYIAVDGETFSREQQSLAVNGKPPRSFIELASCSDEHWDPSDEAVLHIAKPGGLAPGRHQVAFRPSLLDGYFKAKDEWVDAPPALYPALSPHDLQAITYTME